MSAFVFSEETKIAVGDEITFDSDTDSDDEDHTHKGEVKLYTPKNKQIKIKSYEDGNVFTYFIDEIKIKAISPSTQAHETQAMLEKCVSFDLAVFENEDEAKCIITENSNEILGNCTAIRRLIFGLKYYSKLNVLDDITSQDIFANFVDNIYKTLLDDYNHLDDIHNDQLQEINQILIENKLFTRCQIDQCLFTDRHHALNDDDNYYKHKIKTPLDPSLNLYKETMDSLHFYLFHLFDCGLMTLKTVNDDDDDDDKKDADDDDDEYNDDDYYDHELYKIQNSISDTKRNTINIDRYNGTKNNKFSIQVDDTQSLIDLHDYNNDINNDSYITPKDAGSTTFVDEIQKHLVEVDADCMDISSLTILIESEQYDTDSIISDMELNEGNIAKVTNNKETLKAIKQFIKTVHLQSTSFSIGLIFYYWQHYKDLEEIESFDEENVNDHGGHAIKDLYISKKYDTFKEEIFHYKHISKQDYENVIAIKAMKYLETQIAKKMKAEVYGDVTHYGIKQSAQISFAHLVSVILYCDFSDLCTDFSGTFRKKTPFESLESIKRRNRDYYWMSKILRETVEVYGQNREGVWDGINEPKYDPKNRINKLIGPFFTGLSFVMTLPEFNIRLCSPTSTSKRIEVAVKFGGDGGMVIQLNNPKSEGYNYELGKGFNCSWISRYKEEDERLFFGGSWRTKIETIRIMHTQQNFGTFLHALTYFDGMVNGAVMDGGTIRKKDRKIIQKLINWRLMEGNNKAIFKGVNDENKFDEYVYKTFDCFCRNKIQIVLSLETLQNYCDKQLRDIIMHPIVWNIRINNDTINRADKVNLFREVLFKLFPNLSTVVIYSAPKTYTFSLMALLSLIQLSPSLTCVKIKAEQNDGQYGFEGSWLYDSWSSIKTVLIEEYEKKGYEISFNTVKSVMSGEELEAVDRISIRKM